MNKTHSHDTATPALSVESGERQAWPKGCTGYMPDYQAGGDCVNCGRVREDHAEFAAPAPNPSPAAKGGEAGALPCPFCGSPAKLIHRIGKWLGREKGYGPRASRYVCSALYDNPSRDCEGLGASYGPEQDAEALVRWNTRAALATPSPQPADAVREAVEAVLAEVDEAERTNTRNARTDWRAREFFVKHGRALRAALASDPAPAGEAVEPVQPFFYLREHDMRALAMPASRWRDGVRIYRVPEHEGEKLHPLFTHPAPEDNARLGEDLERVTRELTETKRRLAEEFANMDATMKGWDALCIKCDEAERDRDDARKALETVRGYIADFEAENDHDLKFPGWLAVIDAARSASREGASDE